MGAWSKLNSNVGDLLTTGSGAGGEIVSAGSIFGSAALIGLVNIVLLTAMATVGAYIYNLSTDIVGGVEVTLADLTSGRQRTDEHTCSEVISAPAVLRAYSPGG